ncbi:Uncharacterized protein OBRU01_05753 [Operophtera brumata]|uniref:Uncharacterized protein n=1 Tax=Operophtera brumata TaxID=104452 RepID=A0A0L7LLX0_OPEBR|nr:Uncharacterized protein OBRU01_05753 [Operophtera brumata]
MDIITEKWEFQDILKNLESRWSGIDKVHWELDSESDSSNGQYEKTFSEHERTYNDMKKALNSKKTFSHREKTTPQMEVPNFHGNYHQWVCFKGLFTEAIHSNSFLSNAQKIQFLKSKVKGEAERLIQHLNISSDNYSICWEILQQRYNNKKMIFSSHMNILLNLPVMQQASVNHIKRIHDTTQETMNAIKNLGTDVTSWDPLIVYILCQKLDSDTHSEYMKSVKQPRELPVLSEFLTFLESQFTSMEASRRKQDNSNQKQRQNVNDTPSTNQRNSNSHVTQQDEANKILLSTAMIKVQKVDGTYQTMRALIDQGSQTSLITENAAQQLGLQRQKCKEFISGIGAKDNTDSRCIKLPRINIQPYDGREISGFQPFIDLFTAIIDKDVKLSDIEKMYYLKTLLKGEPLQIIEGLAVSNESYKPALQLLTKRYCNPHLVISTHINTLLDMPSIQRGTAQQLREITSKIRQQLSAHKTLNQPTDKWDAILMCIVTRKLDPLTVRLFHSEKDYATVMPTLNELLEFLDKRAVSIEVSFVSPMYNDKSKPKSVTLAGTIDPKKTAASAHCTACNESHRLYKCPKFVLMSIDKKLEHVNKNKHCVICLGLHPQKCRYQFKCNICKSKDHNTLLHVEGKQDEHKENHSVSLHSYKAPQTKVLLPTVKFLESDASGNRVVVRGLLDSGSQTSLCTSRLADRLGIQPFNHEKNILTLGDRLNKTNKAINITIYSLNQNFKADITCSIVNQITAPMPQRKFEFSSFMIPKNITLADNEYNIPGVIDVLLGAEMSSFE